MGRGPGTTAANAGSWRKRFSELFKGRRASETPVVEDHPYRTAECPIDEELIVRLDELTRTAQEQAIEQAWSIDWTLLASSPAPGSRCPGPRKTRGWLSARSARSSLCSAWVRGSTERVCRPEPRATRATGEQELKTASLVLSRRATFDRGEAGDDPTRSSYALSRRGTRHSQLLKRSEPAMSATPHETHPATLCARGPGSAESTSRPLVPPLDLSVVYCPDDLDHVDALYNGSAQGFTYARDGHPNAAQLASSSRSSRAVRRP